VIKGSDEFLRFAFLTGVSKFTKTSIFSGLNNITDISLDKPYGDICGYSQHDVETTFAPYLEGVDMDKLKEWYNGYNFLGSQMYNPFDILKFIAKDHTYSNYWFESGTPTFLIELIKKQSYFLPSLANLRVDQKLLNSFDIENLDLEVILYQSGYLTIENVITTPYETTEYQLKIPNKEVKISLHDSIIHHFFGHNSEISTKKTDIYKSLANADFANLEKTLTSLFASISHHNYTKNLIANYEGFYASVIYAYLASLGLEIISEDTSNRGRIDMSIKIEDKVYILEFKVDEKGALEQIKAKNYHQKYLKENKDIYLLGIEFSSKERNITNMEWEVLQ